MQLTHQRPHSRPRKSRRIAGVLLGALVLAAFAAANFIPRLQAVTFFEDHVTVLAFGWPTEGVLESVPASPVPGSEELDLSRATFRYQVLGLLFDALVAGLATVGVGLFFTQARLRPQFTIPDLLILITFCALLLRSVFETPLWLIQYCALAPYLPGWFFTCFRWYVGVLLPLGTCGALYAIVRVIGALLRTETTNEQVVTEH